MLTKRVNLSPITLTPTQPAFAQAHPETKQTPSQDALFAKAVSVMKPNNLNVGLIHDLLKLGLDPARDNRDGENVLSLACKKNAERIVKVLVEKGVIEKFSASQFRAVIKSVAKDNNITLLKILMKARTVFNIDDLADNDFLTKALYLAVQEEHPDISYISALCRSGVSINTTPSDVKSYISAYDIAMSRRSTAILQFFLDVPPPRGMNIQQVINTLNVLVAQDFKNISLLKVIAIHTEESIHEKGEKMKSVIISTLNNVKQMVSTAEEAQQAVVKILQMVEQLEKWRTEDKVFAHFIYNNHSMVKLNFIWKHNPDGEWNRVNEHWVGIMGAAQKLIYELSMKYALKKDPEVSKFLMQPISKDVSCFVFFPTAIPTLYGELYNLLAPEVAPRPPAAGV